MCDALCLRVSKLGEPRVVANQTVRSPIGLAVSHEKEIHGRELRRSRFPSSRQYDGPVSSDALIAHLKEHALRTDGPFTLRSGAISDWYLDARQTTFDGQGAREVGRAVLEVLSDDVDAVGGMTMGADPIAIATAMVAAEYGSSLVAFSIRKMEKDHGTGGRLVGPVKGGMRVAILEDTTTTGSAAVEAASYAIEQGLVVVQAIALVDRSSGAARRNFAEMGIPHVGIVTPADLGVDE